MGLRRWPPPARRWLRLLIRARQLSCAARREEKGNAERFAALKGAADNSDFEAVLRGAGEIFGDQCVQGTRIGPRDVPPVPTTSSCMRTRVEQASTGACDEAKHEAELVLAVDSANKTAR